MSQNYNVDDILEEIRRKKTRQEAPADTYDAPPRSEPPGRARREDVPAGMPSVRPIGTRRAQPPPARQRQSQPYDDSGWGEPAPKRTPPPRPAQERPYGDDASARRQPRSYAPPQPGEPVFGGATGGKARDYREASRRGEPANEEAPRRKAPVSERPSRLKEPAHREPDRRREPARDGTTRWREPVGEAPRRREEPAYEEPVSRWDAEDDTFTGYQKPERREPGRSKRESRDAPPEQAYPEDMARFDDDAPEAPSQEDFSIHFSLDDTATGDYGTQAVREEESLVKSRWHQSFLEQELQEQPVPDDDFGAPEDAPYVEKDLKKLRAGLIVRIVSMALMTLLTVYLVLSIKPLPKLLAGLMGYGPDELLGLPLELIYPDKHPRVFMTLMLLLCAGGALICANIIGAGFGGLFRLRANSDTPAALAVLAVLIQGVMLIIYPDQLALKDISVYIPAALLVLLFTLVGKLMLEGRIHRNFQYLTSEKEKYAMLSVANREFARELSKGLGPEIDEVSYSARADFVTGFLSKSYTGDYSDNFYCVSAPAGFLGALLVGGVTAFLAYSAEAPSAPAMNPVVIGISAFAATMCVCAPLSSAIVPHLMLGRMSKWLCKRGAMLAGYETAEEIVSAGAVVIDEKEAFPGESVQLHGMKVFAEKRIDEAILDAASVMLSCNGLMSGVFLNMIGGNQRMLKKVDGLIYEDGMGVSAWVDGKRVLIGSRELMQNHEVECPSRDFEARYTRNGRRVLYIANSGELTAMFVVSYNGETRTAERLAELERRGIGAILYTTDPNVTSELVSSVFGIRKGSVKVLPAKLHPEYNYLTRFRERVTAGCAHQGGLAGVLQLLRASASVCRSVRAGAITQLVGIIAGYGLMAAMAFTGSLSIASFYVVMLYGFGALAATFLVSNFGKM